MSVLELTQSLAENLLKAAVKIPVVSRTVGIDEFTICDKNFAYQLTQLRKLRLFVINQAIKMDDKFVEVLSLGALNQMKFNQFGRMPTLEEWQELDNKLAALLSCLSDDVRRKFRLWQLQLFFGAMPLLFLLISMASLVIGFMFPWAFSNLTKSAADAGLSSRIVVVGVVLFWTISLGGLGACAFLGTRLMSDMRQSPAHADDQHKDETFDLTDTNLLRTRIIIGILFSFLIGIPFANYSVRQILSSIEVNTATGPAFDIKTIPLVLMPFLIGFSMSLVLLFMDRFVSAVQTFLGPSSRA